MESRIRHRMSQAHPPLKRSEALLILLLVVVALGAAISLVGLSEQDSEVREAVLPPRLQVPAAPVQAESASFAEGAVPVPSASKGMAALKPPLMFEFDLSRNYRVLFHEFMKRPLEGGGFYAHNILRMCGVVHEDMAVLAAPGTSAEQDAARQLLIARCASFTDDEVSEDAVYRLEHDARVQSDPLLKAWKRFAESWEGVERRLGYVATALESGDPLLMDSVAHLVAMNDVGQPYRLHGEVLSQPNAQYVVSFAWTAAVCETGMECGPTEGSVAYLCAMAGQCFPDRRAAAKAHVEREYGKDGLALFDKVYPILARSIVGRDVSGLR